MRNRIPQALLLLLMAPLACSTRTSREVAEHYVPVLIENDLISRSDVTIRMIAANGASTVLGGTAPGRSGRFSFNDPMFSGSYRLTAETGDGRTIESRRFTLFPGAAVLWRLQRNDLQVSTTDALSDPGLPNRDTTVSGRPMPRAPSWSV